MGVVTHTIRRFRIYTNVTTIRIIDSENSTDAHLKYFVLILMISQSDVVCDA